MVISIILLRKLLYYLQIRIIIIMQISRLADSHKSDLNNKYKRKKFVIFFSPITEKDICQTKCIHCY